MKKNCSCNDPITEWIEFADTTVHSHRVICGICHAYVKWGTYAEFKRLSDSGAKVVLKPPEYEPRRNTLDRFFVNTGKE
jgi:hypothetical protein